MLLFMNILKNISIWCKHLDEHSVTAEMLNLKTYIDQNSGFCFGVVFAIEIAEEILKDEGHLYCLGDIVHNDEEVKRLEQLGLEIISHRELENIKGGKVLIRAHGEPPETYELAIKNDLTLVDASCPVVLKLQNRIKNSYDKNEKIYIYGKHGHAEVKGLLGQTDNRAVVFQEIEELDMKSLPDKITLYSQTTKSTDNFYDIKEDSDMKCKAFGIRLMTILLDICLDRFTCLPSAGSPRQFAFPHVPPLLQLLIKEVALTDLSSLAKTSLLLHGLNATLF